MRTEAEAVGCSSRLWFVGSALAFVGTTKTVFPCYTTPPVPALPPPRVASETRPGPNLLPQSPPAHTTRTTMRTTVAFSSRPRVPMHLIPPRRPVTPSRLVVRASRLEDAVKEAASDVKSVASSAAHGASDAAHAAADTAAGAVAHLAPPARVRGGEKAQAVQKVCGEREKGEMRGAGGGQMRQVGLPVTPRPAVLLITSPTHTHTPLFPPPHTVLLRLWRRPVPPPAQAPDRGRRARARRGTPARRSRSPVRGPRPRRRHLSGRPRSRVPPCCPHAHRGQKQGCR